MQVGGMSGAGASAASGSSAQVSAAPASAGVGGEDAGSGQGAPKESGGIEISNNISIQNHNNCNMSTQDYMQLGSVGESQGTELDLQKLIEMLLLMKLLECLGQQGGAV